MAGFIKIKDLEERKRALARESDIYREVLKIEVHNLRLYLVRARTRFTSVKASNPLLMLAGPLASLFLRRRGFPKMRLVTGALFAWRLVRKLRALLPGIFRRRKRARRAREEDPAFGGIAREHPR
jgi:hypothetical protein